MYNYLKQLFHQNPARLSILVLVIFIVNIAELSSFILMMPLFMSTGFAVISTNSSGHLQDLLQHFHFNLMQSLFIFTTSLIILAVFRMIRSLLMTQFESTNASNLRENLYQSLIFAKWQYLQNFHKGRLSELLILETNNVAYMNKQIMMFINSILVTFIYLVLSFYISWKASCVVFAIVAIAISVHYGRYANIYKSGLKLHHYWQELQEYVHEHLLGIKVAKCYGTENYHFNQFTEMSQIIQSHENSYHKESSKKRMIIEVSSILILAAIFYISNDFLHEPIINLIIMILIFLRLSPNLQNLQDGYETCRSMMSVYDVITQIKNDAEQHSEKNNSHTKPSLHLHHNIQLKNISFSYGNDLILKNINLTIPAKSFIALIGASGIGKTTLAEILAGLHLPSSGKVLIDNIELNENNYLAWRKNVAFVTQDTFLFHDTIEANLRLVNPNVSHEQMMDVIRLAQAEDIIHKLPNGLATIIGDSGVRLSGGEQQRLALARAILSKPDILILDEVTSFLDANNIHRILSVLQRLKEIMTIVFISHQSIVAEYADDIITLGN